LRETTLQVVASRFAQIRCQAPFSFDPRQRLAAGASDAVTRRLRLEPLSAARTVAALQRAVRGRRGWRGIYDFDSGCKLLDWGAHTADLCQWANGADDTTPAFYEPTDAGGIDLSDEALRASLPPQEKLSRGTDAAPHARNFFDSVKSRKPTLCNADVIRKSHITCHAAAIAWMLGRTLTFDPARELFTTPTGLDDEANGLRRRPERDCWAKVENKLPTFGGLRFNAR
jgi:hypothetical protein